MDKEARYAKLVEKRRACTDCVGQNVKTLCSCNEDEFGSQHIGPWTDWQGNLNAELMVVGREWGGEKNYLGQHGRDNDKDDTNHNLVALVNAISKPLGYIPIEHPSKYQGSGPLFKGPHYFTNSLLCLKRGGATKARNPTQPRPAIFTVA